MSIIHRNGPLYLYDKNKLVPFQWAFPNDGTIRCCTSPGVEKIMVTTDDVQDLLNTSPEAYTALQSLLEDLEGNPSQLTNILNRLIKLEGTVNPEVNSLASLKLLTAMVDGSTILCKGLGLYRYDSSSSATADDFFIIAPNTVPGRWILLAETAMGFSPDTGTANTFILSLPGLTAYYTGMMVWFKATYANTGTCTINVNALGAKSLIRPGGIGLAAGDITAGSLICAVYDGTSFQIISNLATNLVHLTAIQTLTNKTLTSPTLNTPTINTPTMTTPKMSSGTTINDANGNELIRFPAVVASAVNEVTISNSITGSPPSISASGNDTNISLNLNSKGSGTIRNIVNGVISALFDAVASAVNYLTVKANTAGNAPTIAATGTDTNIDVNVVPKGSGRLKENGVVVIRQGEDYRPNLLINADFKINSLGKASYTSAGYVMDKWEAYGTSAFGSVGVSADYISVTAPSTSDTYIIQSKIKATNLVGKKLTLSLCDSSDNIYSVSGVLPSDGSQVSTTLSTNGSAYFNNQLDGTLRVVIIANATKTISIKWVKLETNDHSTPFIPKSYKEEILDTSDNVGYAPNLLINGDFQVWQRGTTFNAPSGAYTADRWKVINAVDTNVSVVRSGRAFRIQEYSAVGGTNSYTSAIQVIEDFSAYIGKTLTFSCDLVIDSGVTIELAVSEGATSYFTGAITTSGIKTLTFKTSNSLTGLTVYITMYRQGMAVGKGITVNWAKLEVNDHTTPFISRSYGEELALCRRYYQVLENTQALPPTARMTASIYYLPGQVFPVKMRVAPTVSIYSTNYKTLGKITEGNNGNDTGLNVSAHGVLDSGFTYIKSDAAYVDATVGYSYKYTADAEM